MTGRQSLMTLKEAVRELNITERHLRELVYRKDIPYVKVGRLLRFDPSDLAKYINDSKVVRNDG